MQTNKPTKVISLDTGLSVLLSPLELQNTIVRFPAIHDCIPVAFFGDDGACMFLHFYRTQKSDDIISALEKNGFTKDTISKIFYVQNNITSLHLPKKNALIKIYNINEEGILKKDLQVSNMHAFRKLNSIESNPEEEILYSYNNSNNTQNNVTMSIKKEDAISLSDRNKKHFNKIIAKLGIKEENISTENYIDSDIIFFNNQFQTTPENISQYEPIRLFRKNFTKNDPISRDRGIMVFSTNAPVEKVEVTHRPYFSYKDFTSKEAFNGKNQIIQDFVKKNKKKETCNQQNLFQVQHQLIQKEKSI